MPTAAIYCRISNKDDKYPKIEEQEADCRALALAQGYTVPDGAVFVDDNISATKGKKRAGFEDLLLGISAGNYDFVLAKEQSRFERSPVDYNRIATVSGVTATRWHTVFEGIYDPANDDPLIGNVRSAMNASESRRNSKRVTSRNAKTIAAGKPIVTKRPFGFERDGITIRDSEADAIRVATRMVIEGHSINEIWKGWKARGITPVIPRKELLAAEKEHREPMAGQWSPSTIVDVLRRPRNAGHIVHRGDIVQRKAFPGIVSAEEYEALMSILSRPERSVTRSRELRHMLSGVPICGTCGAVLRPTTVKGKPVYRCGIVTPRGDVKHPMIMAKMLDEYIAGRAGDFFVLERPKDTVSVSSSLQIQQKLAEVRGQKELLAEQALTPGFGAIFKKKAAELFSQEEELQQELDAHVRSSAEVLLEVESRRALWRRVDGRVSFDDAAQAAKDVSARFMDLPVEERRAVVRSIMHVTVHPGVGLGRVVVEFITDGERPEQN